MTGVRIHGSEVFSVAMPYRVDCELSSYSLMSPGEKGGRGGGDDAL